MTAPKKAKATKTQTAFRMEYAILCRIDASSERIWSLLTDAEGFPRWNSTVTTVGGTIALGQTLELRVPAAPGRVFKPKVTKFEPAQSMVWSDGVAPLFKGRRTFTLTPMPDGSTDFSMSEVLSGLMLPMIKGSLPDFAPVFDTYAADLKREAEGSPS
jgi:hypothetical protein